MATALSATEARRIAIAAQGLAGRRHSDPRRLLRELAVIQLDTISVLARSHQLVCFARLGPLSAERIDGRLWGPRSGTLEYWAHAACLMPVEFWPLMAMRRRRNRTRDAAGESDRAIRAGVLRHLHDAGPSTIAELGGGRRAPGWWEWSPAKHAAEALLAIGDVVCVERRGWRRVYDLPQRAIAADLLAADLDDDTCARELVRTAIARLGVATLDDIADFFRMTQARARSALADSGIEEVRVEGWDRPAFIDPAWLSRAAPRTHRPVLVSPFDSLIWYRPRALRVFDFHHRLETYTPAAQRQHGYFVMPLLSGGRIRGRVDPKRDGTTLVIRRLSVDPAATADMAAALAMAAAWVACDRVVIERAGDDAAAAAVRGALDALGLS